MIFPKNLVGPKKNNIEKLHRFLDKSETFRRQKAIKTVRIIHLTVWTLRMIKE